MSHLDDFINSNDGGVPGFPDTFWGENDKKYMDRLALDMVKIRGVNCVYYKKQDLPVRTDGAKPGSNNPALGPFDPKGRLSSAALYGESLDIGSRIDSISREIKPAWGYAPPVPMRGVAFSTVQGDTPDERGHFETRKLTLHLARAMCDSAGIIPQIGDVFEFSDLLHGFYDVELSRRDSHRFGGTGFFTAYELNLSRNTKFLPQRKNLPEEQI
jgi:hypothetical protein